jgi:hypothetical protein
MRCEGEEVRCEWGVGGMGQGFEMIRKAGLEGLEREKLQFKSRVPSFVCNEESWN